jgi:hypothetical protein
MNRSLEGRIEKLEAKDEGRRKVFVWAGPMERDLEDGRRKIDELAAEGLLDDITVVNWADEQSVRTGKELVAYLDETKRLQRRKRAWSS